MGDHVQILLSKPLLNGGFKYIHFLCMHVCVQYVYVCIYVCVNVCQNACVEVKGQFEIFYKLTGL